MRGPYTRIFAPTTFANMNSVAHTHPQQLSFEDTKTAFAAQSDKALRKKYLVFSSINNNLLTKVGTAMLKGAFQLNLPIKGAVKYTVF